MSNTIPLKKIRELDLEAPTALDRPSYLSAASGLAIVASNIYVVADDEQYLGMFPLTGNAPGKLLKLFDGELPIEKKARKKLKADLESLLLLPPLGAYAYGALFAIGSGSKQNRNRGVLLPLNAQGTVIDEPRVIDLSLIFAPIASQVGDLNIEGAVIANDRFCFLQRGNKGAGINAIVSFSLKRMLQSLTESAGANALPFDLQRFELGSIDGIPLGFTDAAALPDGRIVFTAVAEDSDNSYTDGDCAGSVVGILALDGKLKKMEQLAPGAKVEGIDVHLHDGLIQLLLVSDADDVAIPASLYWAEINASLS